MSRLIGLGWSNRDDLRYHECKGDTDAWDALVYHPQPLTEDVWEVIHPELISLLEIARKRRLDNDRNTRLQEICHWLSRIRNEGPPLATMKHTLRIDPPDEEKFGSTADLDEPFPQRTDILDWQVFQDLLTAEVPIKQLCSLLNRQRGDIEQEIFTWQRRTEKHLASLVRQDCSNGIPKPQIIRDSLFYAVRNPSYDAAILLRADVFFYICVSWSG
ncbi:hypothetical protein FRC07_006447 [Ceratobasidium sp. 392]|nr:hypothetical protein FRC07_006447 [Ceratobasidium sp. 392]